MRAFDLDGALADFSPEGLETRVNIRLIYQLRRQGAREIAICTNQGGLPWHVAGILRRDGRPYPSPEQFLARLDTVRCWLRMSGIVVAAVRVSCYHPKARQEWIERAARLVRCGLGDMPIPDWRVYTTAAARKPNPLMLRSVRATEYWGDSDEDEQAAQAAGIPFVRVERFL